MVPRRPEGALAKHARATVEAPGTRAALNMLACIFLTSCSTQNATETKFCAIFDKMFAKKMVKTRGLLQVLTRFLTKNCKTRGFFAIFDKVLGKKR